ncbi:hypothetical protein NL676_002745 [Syzygium grande]|nr:hypothetical protein NL676_002745 [Syzygium grande]
MTQHRMICHYASQLRGREVSKAQQAEEVAKKTEQAFTFLSSRIHVQKAHRCIGGLSDKKNCCFSLVTGVDPCNAIAQAQAFHRNAITD